MTPNSNLTNDSIVEKIEFATQNQTLTNYKNKGEAKKPTCLIIDGVDPDDLMEGVKLIKIVENYIRSGTVKYQNRINFGSNEEVDKNKPKLKVDKTKNVVQNAKKHKEVKRPIIMI